MQTEPQPDMDAAPLKRLKKALLMKKVQTILCTAAVLLARELAGLVDFFSVGTNDLTQYTLACDRQNPDIEPFIDTHHEAILRLIEMSAKNAHANGAWIGICGELAADTTLTETFLRMGIDELSVSPAFVLKVRDAVRNVDLRK